ncbi:ABC transporter ATP-binding protein, partial [Aliarcobacter butzleri]|nr:ABC transporter ATP-binding protein [Aliarcobacter butzleri]
MNEKISLKYIFKLLLENKKPLIFGQIITIFAILISIPIPLLLPLLVDEVLLEKPAFIVNHLKDLGIESILYYIVIVTFVVLFLRFAHLLLGVITTKIFTKISKYVTFNIRKKLLNHLKIVNMNEYESLGSGSIA